MPDLSSGLSSSEVEARRAEFGANVLTPPPRTPWWKLYLEKFDDPVIRILLIAAGIAVAVGAIDGKVAEGVGILMAIALATYLAYWNESRAAREFDVLNTTRDDVPVKVRRDGGYAVIPKRDVVVGDVVLIEVGEEIPADGTVVTAVNLLVNESRLTGEATAVGRAVGESLLRGTIVVDGYGTYAVDAVGDRTEIGRTLVESIEDSGTESPLHRQLARLSRVIGVVGFGVAFVVFVALGLAGLASGTIRPSAGEAYALAALGVALTVALVNVWLPIAYDALTLLGLRTGHPNWLGGTSWVVSFLFGALAFALFAGVGVAASWLPASPGEWVARDDARTILRNFMIAVTIIVVAVPEGLAMSVTLSLAYGMRKMTASNTLVRRMDACETIGAATVICCDKTGTLTRNQMRLAEVVVGDDTGTTLPGSPDLRHRLIEALAVNGTAHLTSKDGVVEPVGNPTEGALLLWLQEQGVDYLATRASFPVTEQWTFNTDRKYMATAGRVLHVKGAPEIVLTKCSRVASADGESDMTDALRDTLCDRITAYQSRGMRVIAFATGATGSFSPDVADLTWLALVAIADPVRPDVPAAIAACRRAGVEVKIVTGDNAETATEIARQIGLGDEHDTLTGPAFAALTDEEAKARAGDLSILARARPADKLRLVRLLKERGEVVAVTGDGVNDGPALNHADVGLAMGKTGTAVAREASDIILLDDSFPSILNAVRWGRALYENIQRFILFQLTINVVALALAVLGPFLGYELPLTVMQMLWVNLIMDTFAALALATEPPHDGVLNGPPRAAGAFIVTPAMARGLFGVAAVFLVVLVGLIVYFKGTGELTHGDEPSRAGTLLFTVFVMLQFWNLFNAKAFGRTGSVIPTLGNNPSFLAIAVAIFVGQVLLVQFGGTVFRCVPLSISDWSVVVVSTSSVFVVGEIYRQIQSAPRSFRDAGAVSVQGPIASL
jgi:Ca2+-transporting ATPase